MSPIRAFALPLLAVAWALALAGCGAASSKLSEADARRLIREAEELPAPVAIRFTGVYRKDPLFAEVDRLVKEGHVVPGRVFIPAKVADKGKSVVENVVWTDVSGGGYEIFAPYTHQADVKRIVEMLVDSKADTAVVTYELYLSPTDYLAKLGQLDSARTERAVREAFGGTEIRQKRITLKLWDQGWRISKS